MPGLNTWTADLGDEWRLTASTGRHNLLGEVNSIKCPNCETEFVEQDGYPLKHCDRCRLWFELLYDGSLVPLAIHDIRRFA